MSLSALWPVTQQFQAKNGSNLVSGKVYIYYQGRTALATTYHDAEGTVVNANPVLLDNNGRATVFADTIYSYTIVVCDYYGKELFSQDITLHDAISTAKDVIVMGSNGSVKVDTTTLPNGVQYDLSVNTDIIATKESVDKVKTDLNTLTGTVNNHTTQIGQIQEDINGIESTVVNKKDKQAELNFNGSATKTVKKITQNANGELNVEFADIDLPQEVPNVEITSEDKSIKVSETTDVQTNTKKFDLSVQDGGTTYSAGDAIDLTNDTISVKYGKGLEITTDNKLQLKVGKGLTLDNDTLEVTIDNSVGEVVATVEKLQGDLDKKITTTYPFAQITTMSDFAVYGVTNTSRMIGQLFAVPIASEIRKDDTLLCVNALQNFAGNVSFGIFEYDFAANNGTGSTYWIADTGTVSIVSGENRFKLKNVLNNNYELKSSMLYYAVVAIANNAPINGLMLGSSPAYGQNTNANPKYTLIVSNMDQAIDWTTGTLQGAYFQGYNEQYDIPRLFMMLRNGEGSTPIPVTEPFTDIGSFTLQHQYKVSNLFSMVPDAEGAIYRKVIPEQDVDIASFRYVDYHGSVGQESSWTVLLDDTYTPMKTIGDGTWTIGNSDHTKIDGKYYLHEFTFTTPVHLTANTAYWFMVGGNMNKLGDEWIITYQTPTVTNDLLLVKNMNNVNQWIIPDGGEFVSTKPGMYLRLSDNNKSWTI